MKKYTNDELLRMDAVEVYKLRLDRKIHRFPSGFWQLSEGKENAKKCVIYKIRIILCCCSAIHFLYLKYYRYSCLGSLFLPSSFPLFLNVCSYKPIQ